MADADTVFAEGPVWNAINVKVVHNQKQHLV